MTKNTKKKKFSAFSCDKASYRCATLRQLFKVININGEVFAQTYPQWLTSPRLKEVFRRTSSLSNLYKPNQKNSKTAKKVKKSKSCSCNAQKQEKVKSPKKAQKKILLTNWHPERGAAHRDIYTILQVLATRQVNIFQVTRIDQKDEASPKPWGL